MAKFRSKPVEIEAEQFLPEKRPLPFDRYGAVVCLSPGGRWYAMTRVGSVGLRPGDWRFSPEESGCAWCRVSAEWRYATPGDGSTAYQVVNHAPDCLWRRAKEAIRG